MLWETGGAQTDIASLHSDQVDLESETIHFRRRKLAGKESGGESLLRIGPCLRRLLLQLPKEGYLFPSVNAWNSNTRSSEFCRRCRMLGYKGVACTPIATSGRNVRARRACLNARP
jgi:hypothetical protein